MLVASFSFVFQGHTLQVASPEVLKLEKARPGPSPESLEDMWKEAFGGPKFFERQDAVPSLRLEGARAQCREEG